MSRQSGSTKATVRVSRFLEPIFRQFLAVQRRYLDELEAALAAGDDATLYRLGHAIKGGAATYQLPDAAALGERLEAAGADGDRQTAAALVRRLRDYYETVTVVFVDKSSLNNAPEHPTKTA